MLAQKLIADFNDALNCDYFDATGKRRRRSEFGALKAALDAAHIVDRIVSSDTPTKITYTLADGSKVWRFAAEANLHGGCQISTGRPRGRVV